MEVKLDLSIQRQPNEHTCGPTCLHAVYRYFGLDLALGTVIRNVPSLASGGTFAVSLACDALRRGFSAKIFTYNLNFFDPSWFLNDRIDLRRKLKAQLRYKRSARFRMSTEAYLEFLDLGGRIRFEELTPKLIRRYLNRSIPILTGVSATYLYLSPREFGPRCDYNDVRGEPAGHFVILSGYSRRVRKVQITDPLHPNPVSKTHQYSIPIQRVIASILLGMVTYDANLLILQPKAAE